MLLDLLKARYKRLRKALYEAGKRSYFKVLYGGGEAIPLWEKWFVRRWQSKNHRRRVV